MAVTREYSDPCNNLESTHQTLQRLHKTRKGTIKMPTQLTIDRIDKTFGVSSKELKTYVEREGVDNKFTEALNTSKIVVIHGSSKQGKTSLWKHHTSPDKTLQLNCGTIENITALHTQILKKVGFTISTHKVTNEVSPQVGAEFNFLGISAGAKFEGTHTKSTEHINIDLNPTDANDITDALLQVGFKGTFIIEDFHYLNTKTQKDFTKTLKTFYDTGHLDATFVIVGVWKEANRLEVYNGDLGSRITTINVDEWTPDELTKVISRGEELLEISFEHTFKGELVHHCEGAVYLLQSACRTACITHMNRQSTEDSEVTGDARLLISDKIREQSARYEHFIIDYAEDDRTQKHHIRKWVIAILVAYVRHFDNRNYVTRDELASALSLLHPNYPKLTKGTMISSLGRTLTSVAQRQNDIGITPPVLSYDENARRLNVVDLGFMIWLRNTDLSDVDNALSLPAADGNIDLFIEYLGDVNGW
mgnify:FL=1